MLRLILVQLSNVIHLNIQNSLSSGRRIKKRKQSRCRRYYRRHCAFLGCVSWWFVPRAADSSSSKVHAKLNWWAKAPTSWCAFFGESDLHGDLAGDLVDVDSAASTNAAGELRAKQKWQMKNMAAHLSIISRLYCRDARLVCMSDAR